MYDVFTEITLKNGSDLIMAEKGIIGETDIRQETLKAVVDTGAWTLVINEDIRARLGLKVRGTDTVNLADGAPSPCTVAGPVEVIWKDRSTMCHAVVLPDANDILLGAIPLEALDLTVNPRLGEVVVRLGKPRRIGVLPRHKYSVNVLRCSERQNSELSAKRTAAHGDQTMHRLY